MNPLIFRQKPATVEAMLVTADTDDLLKWGNGVIRNIYPGSDQPHVILSTPNGYAVAHKGQYVVRDPSGRFSVITAETFHSIYEPVVEVGG